MIRMTALLVTLVIATSCGVPTSTMLEERLTPPSEARRVLLVVNRASTASREIGEYYALRRKIPASNVVTVNMSMSDNVSPSEYKSQLEDVVRERIERLQHRIDFIVLTKGIPIRLRDDSGYSVDGHLAGMKLNFEPIVEPKPEEIQRALNPYFNKRERFSSEKFGFYLVTRLDGYEVSHVKRMIDAGIRAEPTHAPFLFVVDPKKTEGGYQIPHRGMLGAAQVLRRRGFNVLLEESGRFVGSDRPLAGYVSWGSNHSGFDPGVYRSLRFVPGALAETYVSTSARSFSPRSSGQSMIADLIENGVTGVKGYVSEPFTFALAIPEILFERYTSGYNLAESFYAASLVLKWKDIVVGDPLVAPYAVRVVENGPRDGAKAAVGAD